MDRKLKLQHIAAKSLPTLEDLQNGFTSSGGSLPKLGGAMSLPVMPEMAPRPAQGKKRPRNFLSFRPPNGKYQKKKLARRMPAGILKKAPRRLVPTDVDNYKWKALERHSNMVHLKYNDPKQYHARAAFLPPMLDDTSESKEAHAMADLRVEIAKRKLQVQKQNLLKRMGQELLEKNCAALNITDPKERAHKYQQILKYLRNQDEVNRCASCCCDENMGSVIEYYRRVYNIYQQKATFQVLLDEIKHIAENKQAPPERQVHNGETFPTFAILYAKCDKADNFFHKLMKPLIERCKGTYLRGPVKRMDSCQAKLRRKYSNDHTRLVDVIRGTGVFRQAGKLMECLRTILTGVVGDANIEVLRVSDRMNTPAPMEYRDLKMNVLLVDFGVICEMQLHMDGFYKKKEELHKHYEIDRAKKLADTIAADRKRSSMPDIIGLSVDEMHSLSAEMVAAQQEVDTATRVRTEFYKNAEGENRKASLAELLRMQVITRDRQDASMDEHVDSMTEDPAADTSAYAAKIAKAAARFATHEACDRSDLAVALARRIFCYSASLIACRAAAAAAETAKVAVLLLGEQMWLETEREVEDDYHETTTRQRERLRKELNEELAALQVRARMGMLWEGGMADQFVTGFTTESDEKAASQVKYVIWPLAGACFSIWKAWLFTRKLTDGKSPPRISRHERRRRQQRRDPKRRARRPMAVDDEDSSDEDEEYEGDASYWAGVHEQHRAITVLPPPPPLDGSGVVSTESRLEVPENCCPVMQSLGQQWQWSVVLVRQFVSMMVPNDETGNFASIQEGAEADGEAPATSDLAQALSTKVETAGDFWGTDANLVLPPPPRALACEVHRCRQDKKMRLVSAIDAQVAGGGCLDIKLGILFKILADPCYCEQMRMLRIKSDQEANSKESAAVARARTRMSTTCRLSMDTVNMRLGTLTISPISTKGREAQVAREVLAARPRGRL
jgi:hypothetical protein